MTPEAQSIFCARAGRMTPEEESMNHAQIYIEYEGVRYTQEQWTFRQIEKKLDMLLEQRQAAITEAVTIERERCAAIAEAMGCDAVATAIRNPSKTG